MKYFYGMRLRGFSPGCQPMKGFIQRLDFGSNKYWDVIIYDRPLSKEDERHFSLTPLYGFEYTDNLGNEELCSFENVEDAARNIEGRLMFAYDEYCKTYPDSDVTWLNRYLDCGNTAEVYVPDSDCYTRCELFEPHNH